MYSESIKYLTRQPFFLLYEGLSCASTTVQLVMSEKLHYYGFCCAFQYCLDTDSPFSVHASHVTLLKEDLGKRS